METEIKQIDLQEFKKILEKEQENSIEIDVFDYRNDVENYHVLEVIEKGIDSFYDECLDYNLDYIADLEQEYVNNIFNEYAEEIEYLFKNGDDAEDYIRNFMPAIELNIKRLLDYEITVLIPLYSNYDCTNSFDTLETSDYLKQVFKRVKNGVTKEGFINEHINGAYGGSLFCFAFNCSLSHFLELNLQIQKKKYLIIPQGTQYGFFSSSQVSSSPFEKETYQDFKLKIVENTKEYSPDYDHIGIIADLQQHYSLKNVFGDTSFIKEQTIIIK